ncbi:hypothetical protein HaLaN_24248, partial [Haematococcus lacustris]
HRYQSCCWLSCWHCSCRFHQPPP